MYKLRLQNAAGREATLLYNPLTHGLSTPDGEAISAQQENHGPAERQEAVSFRIVMGKGCNFRCAYCIQNRETRHPELSAVDALVGTMLRVLNGRHVNNVLFWGGEPLLYFHEIKTLHAELSARLETLPNYIIITNGSLLKGERFQWILDNRISIGVSWDGDGQALRGADPFADPEVVKSIRRLHETQPERLSFNPVMTRLNPDHAAYAEKLKRVLGIDSLIAEGRPVSLCDEGSLASAMPQDFMPEYSRTFHRSLVAGTITHMTARQRAAVFIRELCGSSRAVPTVCSAAAPDVFTMDLAGNLLTCQTFGTEDVDDYGESMWLGNLASLNAGATAPVPALTGMKKRQREHCGDCVVLRLCRGGCPYTPEKYFEQECWYNYHHYMAIFGLALHILTGDVLTEVVPVGAAA